MLALGLWPLASLVLTLPVLAILYRRDGRLRFWSALGAYLSVLYLLALMCFTLYPLPSGNTGLGITYGVAPQLDFWVFIDDIRRDGKVAVLQLLANVAFFVPLGIIVGRGLRKGFGWALVLGFLVSLFVETAQLTGLFWIYPFAYRTFDVDDLACNTLGCVIGWCLAAVINRLMPVRRDDGCGLTVETHPGIVRRTVALCLDMTIIMSVTGIVCAGALLSFVLGQILALDALDLLRCILAGRTRYSLVPRGKHTWRVLCAHDLRGILSQAVAPSTVLCCASGGACVRGYVRARRAARVGDLLRRDPPDAVRLRVRALVLQ